MAIVASNSITVSNVNDGTITHYAYAYSADGTDKFTTVYPNLNLLTDSKEFTNKNVAKTAATTSIISPDSTIVKDGNDTYLKFIKSTQNQDWFRAYMILGSSVSPNFPNVDVKPNTQYTFSVWLKGTGTHTIIAYNNWTNPNPTTLTANLTDAWTKYVLTVNTSSTIPTQDAQFFIRSGTVGSEINLKYPKVEEGSVATPYMQSSSEVKTDDWPSYIGQYTDFTQADSTTASDYTWSLIRGNDGKDGADGIAGKDGKGIKSTAITYQASANGTTAPTGTWSASVPTVAKGSFLWTRTIWTYTDNTTETGYAVAYMGTNGNNGTDGIAGKDGVGIKTTTITYVGSTSGTTAPTSGWTSAVPTVAAGSYLWTKTVWTYTDNTSETGYSVAMMGVKGDKGDPGIKGSDGTSGIIVSSVAPSSPQTGQLWQDTSTTPQLIKKWTGNQWVIWEMYAINLKADNISTISLNLGDMTGGTVKLTDDVAVNGTLKKHGIYQSKLGLLSSGPSLSTPSTFSDSQMGVANLNKGELRFIVTDYTEDLKTVQETGMSDSNNAFIKFDSYDNGKDVMVIGSSGDIVFKGTTSQDTQWITLSSGVKYKFMFSRVYISVDVVGNGRSFMSLGIIPQEYRPIDQFMIIANWGTGTADDRHIMVRASDGAVILWAPKSGVTYRGEVSYTL